ncbi:MAG TPA: PhnD/SsuA/transferrin family substrate-binding protein [Falsiroseomonas sp.]|jgi:phosphonate transport system substrate-binding protein|nr:PhnD/SsuA/transferrin family substrate-binding protein [Falsiroseomonas sp.]
MKSSGLVSRRTLLAAASIAMPGLARAAAPVRFGLTPVFLDSDLVLLRDLGGHLEAALGVPVQLVKRRTYQEVVAMLLAGQLDAAWICGFPYVRHADRLSLLAVPVHRGRPLYQSYLISDASLQASSIDELRGHSHAFSDPDSNSGFLVTRWLLAARRERPEAFFSRPFFAYGHRNVLRAVGAGLAESGSVDGYVWETVADREPNLTSGTRVIGRSEWHGFPPICCLTERREGPTARALAAAFIEMGGHASGRRVLEALQLDGFVPGEPSLYGGIARMAAAVGMPT